MEPSTERQVFPVRSVSDLYHNQNRWLLREVCVLSEFRRVFFLTIWGRHGRTIGV